MSAAAKAAVTDSEGRCYVIAGRVLHVGIGQVVLLGIGELDVAHRAWQLLDLAETPSLPLPPSPTGQLTEVPLPTLVFHSSLTLLR